METNPKKSSPGFHKLKTKHFSLGGGISNENEKWDEFELALPFSSMVFEVVMGIR